MLSHLKRRIAHNQRENSMSPDLILTDIFRNIFHQDIFQNIVQDISKVTWIDLIWPRRDATRRANNILLPKLENFDFSVSKSFFLPLLRGQAMWFRVWYLGPTRPSCLVHVIYDGAQTVIWRTTFFTNSFYFLIYYHPLSQWMYTSHLRNISSYSF